MTAAEGFVDAVPWEQVGPGDVVSLGALDAAAMFQACDPTAAQAPTPLVYRPFATPQGDRAIAGLMDALRRCATELFPAWPDGAEDVLRTGGAEEAAMRIVARRWAAKHLLFGPYVMEASVRALRGEALAGAAAAETEARELPRVIAVATQRPRLVLLVQATAAEVSTTATDLALAQALEWLAFQGQFGIIVGGVAGRAPYERFRSLAIESLDMGEDPGVPTEGDVAYPPAEGRPHPRSDAEKALASALANRPWAAGAAFNRTLTVGPLRAQYRVDVLWKAARVVLEVDGPEHRREPKFSRDRRRDAELRIAGFEVVRVTNAQVRNDREAVLELVRRFLEAASRRLGLAQHGGDDG